MGIQCRVVYAIPDLDGSHLKGTQLRFFYYFADLTYLRDIELRFSQLLAACLSYDDHVEQKLLAANTLFHRKLEKSFSSVF